MEFLLNEKSLEGQFDSITSFLMSIKPVIKNIELIHKSNMPIYKTTDFYNCKITKNKNDSLIETIDFIKNPILFVCLF